MKRFLIIMLALSLITAGVVSWFASSHPDGLERVAEDNKFIEKAEDSSYELFPDYTVPGGLNEFWSNGLAGFIGTIATFCLVILLGKFISRKKGRGGPDASHTH